jgi:hypothetical protein
LLPPHHINSPTCAVSLYAIRLGQTSTFATLVRQRPGCLQKPRTSQAAPVLLRFLITFAVTTSSLPLGLALPSPS